MTESVRTNRRHQCGFALTELLPYVAAVLVVVSGLWLLSSGDDERVRAERDAERALALARAGITRAVDALDRGEPFEVLRGEEADGAFRVASTLLDRGRYRIESVGVVGDIQRRTSVVVQAEPTGHRRAYRHGFASAESIEVGDDTIVDSCGAAADHGRLTANAAIYVGANAVIRGVVRASARDGFYLDESSRHIGEHIASEAAIAFAPPAEAEFDAALRDNRNDDIRATRGTFRYDPDALTLAVDRGAVVELPAGVFLFSSLRLAADSWLVVGGETKVYVTGEIDCSAGTIINRTLDARNLEIIAYPYDLGSISPPSEPAARLGGGPASALTVYAPGHEVTLRDNGTTFYGAVTAKRLKVRHMHLRFDPSLELAAPPAPNALVGRPHHVELERHEDASGAAAP